MIKQSKADRQVERDMKEADAREAERQADAELRNTFDRQEAARERLTWWQRFKRAIGLDV